MALITCTTVGTTKRGKSSPSKKEAMHSKQGGICPLCSRPMVAGEKLIDEHMRALGLCGSNDADNRALVHAECAYEKTYGEDGDAARIAKAKAQKRAVYGFEAPKRPLISRGFPKAKERHGATEPLLKRLPDRARPLIVSGDL